ncbi:hypothetical protein L8106_21277 [Lyngbya sp. PCC 8106]|nr:hypothetical protein L8106_21277 [Lyngbya sp. PCC 8106]
MISSETADNIRNHVEKIIAQGNHIFGIFKARESVLFFLKNQIISDSLRLFFGREDVICLKD